MRSLAKTSVLALVLIGLTGLAASAQPPAAKIRPPVGPGPAMPPAPPIPVLGFHSYNSGEGELVTSVQWGSAAARMGLEPNDIIVRANGVSLTHRGAWYRAMRRAACEGVVRLTVIDCRTGLPVRRAHYLGYGGGGPTLKHIGSQPTPKSAPRKPVDPPRKKHPTGLVIQW